MKIVYVDTPTFGINPNNKFKKFSQIDYKNDKIFEVETFVNISFEAVKAKLSKAKYLCIFSNSIFAPYVTPESFSSPEDFDPEYIVPVKRSPFGLRYVIIDKFLNKIN